MSPESVNHRNVGSVSQKALNSGSVADAKQAAAAAASAVALRDHACVVNAPVDVMRPLVDS